MINDNIIIGLGQVNWFVLGVTVFQEYAGETLNGHPWGGPVRILTIWGRLAHVTLGFPRIPCSSPRLIAKLAKLRVGTFGKFAIVVPNLPKLPNTPNRQIAKSPNDR